MSTTEKRRAELRVVMDEARQRELIKQARIDHQHHMRNYNSLAQQTRALKQRTDHALGKIERTIESLQAEATKVLAQHDAEMFDLDRAVYACLQAIDDAFDRIHNVKPIDNEDR